MLDSYDSMCASKLLEYLISRSINHILITFCLCFHQAGSSQPNPSAPNPSLLGSSPSSSHFTSGGYISSSSSSSSSPFATAASSSDDDFHHNMMSQPSQSSGRHVEVVTRPLHKVAHMPMNFVISQLSCTAILKKYVDDKPS